MSFFKKLFSQAPPPKPNRSKATGPMIRRDGKSVRADEVFQAWSSGDLNRMVAAANLQTHPLDRHFLLQSIVEQCYKGRADAKLRATAKRFAEIHYTEFPRMAAAVAANMPDGSLPNVPVFKLYATILTEDGEYEKALLVCQAAMELGLTDGTKGGFEARIQKIKKLAESPSDRNR